MAGEAAGKRVIDFLTKCTDPFHTVSEVSKRLTGSGFVHMPEQSVWTKGALQRGGKYFVTRNGSCLCAFVVGSKYQPGNAMKMVSAHTDSPCPKLKPATNIQKEGCHQLGVQLYGGGIWHTWFDRTLAMSGRVITACEGGTGLKEHLVQFHQPLMVIPNLCIHLDRANHESFAPNKEKNIVPVISTIEAHSLLQPSRKESSEHSPVLMKLLSDKLGVDKSDIMDFELCLYDFQDPCLGGAYREFILSGRQDNLISCYIATEALIQSESSSKDEETIRMIFLYDNEEVGSQSYQGALSRFAESVIRRSLETLMLSYNDDVPSTRSMENLLDSCLANSYHISSDAAHYVHPNYPEKHEANLKPVMNKGPIVKINANQRYATNCRGMSLIKYLANKASIPVQKLAVRNDSPCGTTVGPLISARLGIETVDIGVGIFSMHSIRETGCVKDVEYGQKLLETFFSEKIPEISVDSI